MQYKILMLNPRKTNLNNLNTLPKQVFSNPARLSNLTCLLLLILTLPFTLLRLNNHKAESLTREKVLQAQTGDQVIDFLYDSSGQRLAKLDDSDINTYYLSPSLEIVIPSGSESVSDISWKRNYSFSGRLVAVREVNASENNLYFTHQDHLASNSLVTDDQGNLVSQQTYYPYGTTRYAMGSSPTQRQYTGQVSDVDLTGLYYYNARYYNPAIAKFTQADTENDSQNKYSYVSNSPIILIDPSGNQECDMNDYYCRHKDEFDQNYCTSCHYVNDLTYLKSSSNKDILKDMPTQDKLFIRNIIKDFKDTNHLLFANISPYDADYELTVLKSLSSYLFNKIPYSPRLIEIWDLEASILEELGDDITIEKARTLSQLYNSLLSEENEIIELKFQSTLSEQYEQKSFVCYNYADTFAYTARELTPDVPVYAGGLPGHAFNFIVIQNNIYTIDPTWNWPLMLMDVDKRMRPFFEWDKVGINTKITSSLSPYYFTHSLQYNTQDIKNIPY